jgi:hypothetical protein
MKHFLVRTMCAAFSMLGFATIAADNWVTVITGEFDGRTYQIDLDSRQSHISQTGWKPEVLKLDIKLQISLNQCL